MAWRGGVVAWWLWPTCLVLVVWQGIDAASVGWMHRVDWPAIGPDGRIVSTLGDQALAARMAIGAQRLQITQPKRIPITTMLIDVVSDGGRGHHPHCQAHPTQRLGSELVATDLAPAFELIPRAPWGGLICHCLICQLLRPYQRVGLYAYARDNV